MGLLQVLKEANLKADIRELYYARIDEFSAFMHSFTEMDFPANVVVPINEGGNLLPNRVKDTLQIQGWILMRIPEDADLISTENAEQYISPLRKKARLFINGLSVSDIVDPEESSIPFTIKPEYAFLNMNLFGVSYTVNLPVLYNVC
jgi:hypothetical protein